MGLPRLEGDRMSGTGEPGGYRHPFDRDWVRLSTLAPQARVRLEGEKGLWVDAVPGGVETIEAARVLLDVPELCPLTVSADTLFVLRGDYRQLSPLSRWRKGVVCLGAGRRVPGDMHWLWPEERREAPPTGRLCTEEVGFSIWHMIALEIYEPEELPAFLELAAEEPRETIEKDLWECMTASPEIAFHVLPYLGQNEIWRLPWPVVKRLLAYRSPLELCLLSGAPFLEYAGDHVDVKTLSGPVRELRNLSEWMLSRSLRAP